MKKAFISHSSPNDVYVQEMVQFVKNLGFDDVFNDSHSIPPDALFWEHIESSICDCDAFVVILSQASVKSYWVDREVSYARSIGKRVIPVRIEDCILPPSFNGRDVLELRLSNAEKHQPNNLPYSPLGSLFKGRGDFLQQMRTKLTQSAKATVITTKPAAVFGAGGVGKTRAAIEYAWQYAPEYTALLFVTADSPERFEANLAKLTGVLAMQKLDQADDPTRLAAVLQWLGTHREWLVIIDNVDTEEAVLAVRAKLAALANGHVVITSRIASWIDGVEPLELDLLELADSRDYLLEKTEAKRRATPSDTADAEQIAKLVGQLALGLEHAGAYINTNRLTLANYIERWQANAAAILRSHPKLELGYPRELLVTWQLSVNELSDAAKLLLEVLSWFSPEAIPESMFETLPDALVEQTPASQEPQGETTRGEESTSDAIGRREPALQEDPLAALAELETYSLIKRKREQPTFSVHRLVQATTRVHLQANPIPSLTLALNWLNKSFLGDPQDVRTWPVLEPLQPHVDCVCEHAYQHGLVQQEHPTSRLLNESAQLYDAKAKLAIAEPSMVRALQIDEAAFGKEHPRVAIELNNLAALYLATNRLIEAEPLMERALQIDEAAFGKVHPNVATDLNNLAQLYDATNRLKEAEPLYERALKLDEAAFGKEHPNVARDLNNLAQLYQATNRLKEAEPLMERALQIDEAAFGKEHPDVARDLNNLAKLYRVTGRLLDSEPLRERALKININSYGNDHPATAISLDDLALLYKATNRLSEAEPLMRRALEIFVKSLGAEHPHSQIVKENYEILLQELEAAGE